MTDNALFGEAREALHSGGALPAGWESDRRTNAYVRAFPATLTCREEGKERATGNELFRTLMVQGISVRAARDLRAASAINRGPPVLPDIVFEVTYGKADPWDRSADILCLQAAETLLNTKVLTLLHRADVAHVIGLSNTSPHLRSYYAEMRRAISIARNRRDLPPSAMYPQDADPIHVYEAHGLLGVREVDGTLASILLENGLSEDLSPRELRELARHASDLVSGLELLCDRVARPAGRGQVALPRLLNSGEIDVTDSEHEPTLFHATRTHYIGPMPTLEPQDMFAWLPAHMTWLAATLGSKEEVGRGEV